MENSDQAAIVAVLEFYFRGHATADSSLMRQAFSSTAHIEGLRGEAFLSWTLQEYYAIFNGTPAADEASRHRSVDLIDQSGPAAIAKGTLVHGSTTFTDYFILLKIEGHWKIVNKVSSAHPTQMENHV